MKSLEAIARETAARLVAVEHVPREPGFNEYRVVLVAGAGVLTSAFTDLDRAESFERLFREGVAAAFLEALREAALPPEVGEPPVSRDRFLAIFGHILASRHNMFDAERARWDDTFAHVAWLERLLAHLTREEPGVIAAEAYRRGFAAGAEAQKESDTKAALAVPVPHDYFDAQLAVSKNPLVALE